MFSSFTGWHLVIVVVVALAIIAAVVVVVLLVIIAARRAAGARADSSDPSERLSRLAELRDLGRITEVEYEARRRDILDEL